MADRPRPRMYRVAVVLAATFIVVGLAVSAARAAGATRSSFGGTLVTVGLLFVLLAAAVRRDDRRDDGR